MTLMGELGNEIPISSSWKVLLGNKSNSIKEESKKILKDTDMGKSWFKKKTSGKD